MTDDTSIPFPRNTRDQADEPRQPALLSNLEALRRAQSMSMGGGRQLLGIAGLPGSGKSTFAKWLMQGVGASAVTVPMDGFHLANSELARLDRAARKGAPDTFDGYGYLALLERLRGRPQETIYAPAFHRDIDAAVAGEIAIGSSFSLVIVEGNYLLVDESPWCDAGVLFDELWFIEVDEKKRIEQLQARHMHFGRSRKEAAEWIERVDNRNAECIARTRSRADYVIAWQAVDETSSGS